MEEEKKVKGSKLKKQAVNKDLIEMFEKVVEYYKAEGDRGRILAYTKGVAALKQHGREIKSGDDVKGLEHIGKGIRDKIQEFLNTGSIKKFEGKVDSKKTKSIEGLSEVWGIGPSLARKLYSKGIHSVDQLRGKNEKLLTTMQKIGLKYYEDLKERIPRSEAEEMFLRIVKVAEKTPGLKEIKKELEF